MKPDIFMASVFFISSSGLTHFAKDKMRADLGIRFYFIFQKEGHLFPGCNASRPAKNDDAACIFFFHPQTNVG